MLGLSACSSQEGARSLASVYGASSDSDIVSRGPVPADNNSMRVKTSSEQVASASSKVTAVGQTSRQKSTEVVGSDIPPAAKAPHAYESSNEKPTEVIASDMTAAAKKPKNEETITDSTETTTVVGSSPVAAPDSEVRFTNQ